MDTVPQYYHPDRQLRIDCAKGHVVVAVVQVFLPFTTSQVLLARLEENCADLPVPVGSTLIAKVYDPRYIHHRSVFGKPWSRSAEEEAARRSQYIKQWKGELRPGKVMPCEPDTDDAVDWEEFYFRKSTAMFWSEVRAYDRLQSMQDVAIPRLYAAGTLNLANLGTRRAIAPPVLLLQYLDDVRSLEELDSPLISQSLLDSALESVQRFTMLGVLHGDLKGSEILGFPAHRPLHAFVIDFGNARIRDEEEGDEQWAEAVLEAGDFRWVEMLFHLHAERRAPH